MRDYGKVYTAFWTSQDARGLSEDGRTLALYLMTCPHGNMLGCFRLSDAYAADDMQWHPERVREGFAELFEKGFAYRCDSTSWVLIRQFLKWNQFENPNVGTAAGKMFLSLSCPGLVKSALAAALREFAPRFPAAILDAYETTAEPFENPFGLISKTRTRATTTTTAPTEPQPTPPAAGASAIVVERRSDVVEAIGDGAPPALVAGKSQAPRENFGEDARAVFSYWQQQRGHERAKLDDKRAKAIKARLKDGYTVGDLCRAVDGIAKSAHHMGQNDTRTVYDDIELICRTAANVDKFAKLAGPVVAMDPGLQQQVEILQDWMNKP